MYDFTFLLFFIGTEMLQLQISQQVGQMVWHSVQLFINTGEKTSENSCFL